MLWCGLMLAWSSFHFPTTVCFTLSMNSFIPFIPQQSATFQISIFIEEGNILFIHLWLYWTLFTRGKNMERKKLYLFFNLRSARYYFVFRIRCLKASFREMYCIYGLCFIQKPGSKSSSTEAVVHLRWKLVAYKYNFTSLTLSCKVSTFMDNQYKALYYILVKYKITAKSLQCITVYDLSLSEINNQKKKKKDNLNNNFF